MARAYDSYNAEFLEESGNGGSDHMCRLSAEISARIVLQQLFVSGLPMNVSVSQYPPSSPLEYHTIFKRAGPPATITFSVVSLFLNAE